MQIQPYLFYEGHGDEAIAFYRDAVGADVQMLIRYKDAPEQANRPSHAGSEKIMHASLKVGGSIVLRSDGRCSGKPAFDGIAVSLTVADAAEAQGLFAALGDGGQVVMPLGQTFLSPQFGMLTDRFGLIWMVVAGG